MSSDDDSPLTNYTRLLAEAPKIGMEQLNKLYFRAWAYFTCYLLVMFAFVLAGWLANTSGNRALVYPLILITIPTSLLLLIKPHVVKPYVIGKLLYGIVIKEKIGFDLIQKLVNQYLTFISSVTYFFVWALLLLTYVDYQDAMPQQYFTIFLFAPMMITLEHLGESKKRFTRFFATASPTKLAWQFVLTLLKMVAPFDLNDLFGLILGG